MLNTFPSPPGNRSLVGNTETCETVGQYRAAATQFLENVMALHRPFGLFDSATILSPQDKLQFAINPKNMAAAAMKHPTVKSAASRTTAAMPRWRLLMKAMTQSATIAATTDPQVGATSSGYAHRPTHRIDNRYPANVAEPSAITDSSTMKVIFRALHIPGVLSHAQWSGNSRAGRGPHGPHPLMTPIGRRRATFDARPALCTTSMTSSTFLYASGISSRMPSRVSLRTRIP